MMTTMQEYCLQSIKQDMILRKQLLITYATTYNTFRRDFPKEATNNDKYWEGWNSGDKALGG